MKKKSYGQLSENAITVLDRRYFLKDEDKNVIEDWDGICWRVANHVAQDEKTPEDHIKWAKEYHDMIFDLKFIPNSPTFTGAGQEDGQLAACVSGDTYIMTFDGLKKMEDIEIGDLVLTHNGRFRRVTNKWYKGIKRVVGVYRANNQKRKSPNGYFTPDHRILQQDGKWVECSFAENAVLPYIISDDIFWGTIFIDRCLDSDEYVVQLDRIYQKNTDKRLRSGEISSQTKSVYNVVHNDNDLGWLFGMYLSEGDIDDNCLRFTLNINETEYAQRIYDIILQKFGVSSVVTFSNHGNWLNVKCHSKIVARLFQSLFGRGVAEKRIPTWIYDAKDEYIVALLDGINNGDAYYDNNNNSRLVLANPSLVYQVVLLNRKIGKMVSYHAYINNNFTKLPTSSMQCTNITCDNLFVADINLYKPVYDIEVEEDHSFVAGDIVCHNCFVLPIEDHMPDILEIQKQSALIHKSGGGTGFSFSRLRPENSPVKKTNGVASGPVSFMKMFNATTQYIKQGGTRRGANMGILRVDHPDILQFINAKQDTSEITNFNISVAITDEFMKAYKEDKEYNLIAPHTGKVTGKLKAKEVWDLICKNAWQTGEPGLFFIDTCNKRNRYGTIEATNPCGEQPLRPWEACNLGSINLGMFFDEFGKFMLDEFIRIIRIATRFLDSVISVNNYPMDIIRDTHAETRKIGLGIMGLADAFAILGLVYGSLDSYKWADSIYGTLSMESKRVSEELGAEKGICKACKELGLDRRNFWTTTIAPTGTISIIANASSGIEPFYTIGYESNRMDGTKMLFMNSVFEEKMKEAGLELTDKLKVKIFKSHSIQHIKEIPEDIRKIFVTAADVSPETHVTMQATFQKYSDSGVSKTINLVESATIDDVKRAYELAYELGCIGVTVYRDNSRPNQVLSVKKEEKKERKVRERDTRLHGYTDKVPTALGNAYITFNSDEEGALREVLILIGKTGEDTPGLIEGAARLVSLCLKYDIPVEQISKQLKGIRGEEPFMLNKKKYYSLFDFIGKNLTTTDVAPQRKTLQKCGACGSELSYQENCLKCLSCGWSKC